MVIFFNLPFSYAQESNIKQQTLVFSSSGDAPVHSFLDAVTREVFDRIGYKVKIKILPTERALVNLNKGLIDGDVSRVSGLEKLYTNIISVPESISFLDLYVYSKVPLNSELGWSALNNKKVGYLRGWKIIDKNIPKSAFVTKARTPQQIVNLLNHERVDYFIYGGWLTKSLAQEFKNNNIQQLLPKIVGKPMYFYLNKKQTHLVPVIVQAIKDMKSDGSMFELKRKYLKPFNAND